MPTGKKFITRDMIIAARDKGWGIRETSDHYGMHRSSVASACERFGIELARSKFDPQMPSTRSKFWQETVEKPKPKTKAIWSCSPRAIERALEKIQHEKRLQATE